MLCWTNTITNKPTKKQQQRKRRNALMASVCVCARVESLFWQSLPLTTARPHRVLTLFSLVPLGQGVEGAAEPGANTRGQRAKSNVHIGAFSGALAPSLCVLTSLKVHNGKRNVV